MIHLPRKLSYLPLAVLAALLTYASDVSSQDSQTYEDSAKSLKQLIEHLQDAADKNNLPRFRAQVEALYLRDHEAWFKEVFGIRLGSFASADYSSRTRDLVGSLFVALKNASGDGYKKLEVEQVDEPCGYGVLDNEYPILFARKKNVPLYSVRYRRGREFRSFGFFVYTNTGFRYLGHIDLGSSVTPAILSLPDTIQVPIEGSVQHAKLVRRETPQYPLRARRARIQGTVRLLAVVARDGTIEDLRLLSGHCWLAEAAIEAVKKWQYQPTMLNGEPIEVVTTIDVVFTLSS